MSGADIHGLVKSIQDSRAVAYVEAASVAILLWDILITFDQEINAIWKSRWNLPRLAYILTRFSSIVEAGVIIAYLSVSGDNGTLCAGLFITHTWLFLFGLGTGELIMTIRTWAVWEKNHIVKYILLGSYSALVATGTIVAAFFSRDQKYAPDPRSAYVGCYATHSSSIIFVNWTMLLLFDSLMFCLMAFSAFKAFRIGGSSRLVKVVYQDGLSYYLYLFILSLLNIIIIFTFSADLLLIIAMLSKSLHTILACRVVLHIDGLARESAITSLSQSKLHS